MTSSSPDYFMEHQINVDNGSEQVQAQPTERLSSNSTLFWRVFVPIFGSVLLSGFLLTFLLIPEEELYLPFPMLWARTGIFVFWLLWFFLIRRTLWRLKRVDVNDAYVFVTNYWVTLRYPWSDVESIEEVHRAGRRVVHLQLRAPGRFGSKISFLPNDRFEDWKKAAEAKGLF